MVDTPQLQQWSRGRRYHGFQLPAGARRVFCCSAGLSHPGAQATRPQGRLSDNGLAGSEAECRRSRCQRKRNRQAHTKGAIQGVDGLGRSGDALGQSQISQTESPGWDGQDRDDRSGTKVDDAGLELSKGEGKNNNKIKIKK